MIVLYVYHSRSFVADLATLDTVLVAVKDQSRSNYEIVRNRHPKTKSNTDKSADITADNILPGASTLDDINTYINTAKKEKLEQLKKKMPSHR